MFPEILMKNNVKYKVIPIGISTTIPAIKLFLILEKIDFFTLFGCMFMYSLNK